MGSYNFGRLFKIKMFSFFQKKQLMVLRKRHGNDHEEKKNEKEKRVIDPILDFNQNLL